MKKMKLSEKQKEVIRSMKKRTNFVWLHLQLFCELRQYLEQTDCTPNDSHFVIWWKGKKSGFVKIENLN